MGERWRRANRGVSGPAYLSDAEVLERARSCPKTGKRFVYFYDYGGNIPKGERSEADWYVCRRLAYWTGCNAEQIKRLFRASDLARGKYAEKGHHAEIYLAETVRDAIDQCSDVYDPAYGEGMKDKVRDAVVGHMDDLYSSDLGGNKRDVMLCLLETAYRCGMYRNGEVEFNDNQEEIAGQLGITQEYVSKIIRSILKEGTRLVRVSKGKKGKNSVYRLPAVSGSSSSRTYAGGSIMYVHSGVDITPPVPVRSRTLTPLGSTSRSVGALKTGPEIVAEFSEAEDHPLGCNCALCSVQPPSYVTYSQGVTDLGAYRRSRERVA